MIVVVLFLFAAAFYTPMYRIAQTKGYPGAAIVRWTASYHAVVTLVVFVLGAAGITHWQLGLVFLPVSGVLLVLQCLPARRGAPGAAWLTVTMACPACQAIVSFDRARQGLVDSCPRCGEILTVGDGAPSHSSPDEPNAGRDSESVPVDEETPATDEWVTLRTYSAAALAAMDRQALEDAGVPALVRPVGAGDVLFPTALGTALLVCERDQERAESVLQPQDEDATGQPRP